MNIHVKGSVILYGGSESYFVKVVYDEEKIGLYNA